MLMSDVAMWVAIVVGFMVAFPATWLLFAGIVPKSVDRAQHRIRTSPVITFFVGIATIFLFVIAVAGLGASNVGPLVGVAVLLAGFGVGFAMFGASGLARHVGQKLPSAVDWDSPWRAHLRGGIILELSFLIPVLGWFLVLPITLILGAGAATLAVLFRAAPPAPQRVAAPKVEEKAGTAL